MNFSFLRIIVTNKIIQEVQIQKTPMGVARKEASKSIEFRSLPIAFRLGACEKYDNELVKKKSKNIFASVVEMVRKVYAGFYHSL